MFGYKRFETTDTAYDAVAFTFEIFRDEMKKDLRGLDLQIAVDNLNIADNWRVSVMIEGSDEFRIYNDNGGAGFGSDGIVLIDDIQVISVRVTLTGASAAPALVIDWRLRGI